MRLPVLLALVVPLLFGCGKIVIEGETDGTGGTGGSGSSGEGPGAEGCLEVECIGNSEKCSCKTTCGGPKLRADCSRSEGETFICECHYDGQYMGTCGIVGGPACSLPGGCCSDYL